MTPRPTNPTECITVLAVLHDRCHSGDMTMTSVMTRTQVGVDRLRPEDGAALAAMFARCSDETIVGRFFTGLRELPRAYAESALAGPSARHDALVLRYGDGRQIAGLASFVADPHSGVPTGELGVLVQ